MESDLEKKEKMIRVTFKEDKIIYEENDTRRKIPDDSFEALEKMCEKTVSDPNSTLNKYLNREEEHKTNNFLVWEMTIDESFEALERMCDKTASDPNNTLFQYLHGTDKNKVLAKAKKLSADDNSDNIREKQGLEQIFGNVCKSSSSSLVRDKSENTEDDSVIELSDDDEDEQQDKDINTSRRKEMQSSSAMTASTSGSKVKSSIYCTPGKKATPEKNLNFPRKPFNIEIKAFPKLDIFSKVPVHARHMKLASTQEEFSHIVRTPHQFAISSGEAAGLPPKLPGLISSKKTPVTDK